MSSSVAVTEIIDPRWEALEQALELAFWLSTCLNIALNREGLTRDRSYPESVHRHAGREGAQCKQALPGPMWAANGLAGC